jgi:hypothetical protein
MMDRLTLYLRRSFILLAVIAAPLLSKAQVAKSRSGPEAAPKTTPTERRVAIEGEENKRLDLLNKKLEGTYQIQVINSRELYVFPLQYLDTIVSKRDQNNVVYFSYPGQPQFRIKILPQSVISSPGFVKVKKSEYVHQK